MKKDFVCQGDFDHKIWGAVSVMMEDVGLVNLSVEQYDFGLFHLLRGALSADFRQIYSSRLKLASLILRILKALCLDVFFPGIFRVLVKAKVNNRRGRSHDDLPPDNVKSSSSGRGAPQLSID